MTDDDPTEPIDPAHDPAHLGLEVISDLDEGLLSEDEADRAREHLAGCELCRADREALSSVRETLASDAAEIVMPDDVAARIQAALADEPAYVPEAAAAVTTLPTPREPSRWEARRKPALIGLGAAAVIVALIFGVIHLPRSTSSTPAASATTAGVAGPPVVVLHSGRNYTQANLNAAIGLLASPSPAESAQAASAGAPATAAGATSAAAPASSAAAATTAAAPVTTAAAAANGGADANSKAAKPTATPDVLAPLRKPGAAQACLQSLLSTTAAPLLIDFARFEGKPAVVGIFDDPDDPTKLQVIAVGPPDCKLYQLSFTPKP